MSKFEIAKGSAGVAVSLGCDKEMLKRWSELRQVVGGIERGKTNKGRGVSWCLLSVQWNRQIERVLG